VLAAARGFSLLSFVAATALLSRSLPQASYGTFRQCWMMYSMVAPIVGIGVAQSLFFFGARSTDGRDWRLVRRGLVLTLAAAALVAAAIAIAARPITAAFSNPTAAPAVRVFAIFIAGGIPLLLSDAIFMTAGRPAWAAAFNILNRFTVFLGLAVPVSFFGFRLIPAFGVLGAAQALVVLLLFLAAYSTHSQATKPAAPVSLRRQILMMAPIVGATVFGSLFLQLDKLIVSTLAMPDRFAVYANGAFENPVVALLAAASAATVAPELVRFRNARDHQAFIQLWRALVEKLSWVVVPMTVFMFVFAPEIVILLFSARYIESAPIFRMYALLSPIRIIGFSTLFMALDRNRVYFWGHVIACAAAGAAAPLLLSATGLVGAVVAIVVVSYLLASAFLVVAARALDAPIRALLPFKLMLVLGLLSGVAAVCARSFCVTFLHSQGLRALIGGGLMYLALLGIALLVTQAVRSATTASYPPAGP